MTAIETPPPPAPASSSEPLLCPLCDYDLRGLLEPRCPECGYTFEWGEITDPSRRLHRYLFEHHPERNAWSFVRTFLGTHAPRRFWRSLLPAQPSRPKRLVLYWCLAGLPLVLALVPHYGLWGWEFYQQTHRSRAMYMTIYAMAPSTGWAVETYGSVSTMLDRTEPLPPSREFFRRAWGNEGRWTAYLVGVLLAWPWLTFLTLLLFRISMRRARIKPVHVLRCVLYSLDSVLWLAPVLAAAVALRALFVTHTLLRRFELPPPPIPVNEVWGYRPDLATDALFWSGLVVLLVMTCKLAAAFRYYLKFDRPVATVLCSQLIVLLFVIVYTIDSLPIHNVAR